MYPSAFEVHVLLKTHQADSVRPHLYTSSSVSAVDHPLLISIPLGRLTITVGSMATVATPSAAHPPSGVLIVD